MLVIISDLHLTDGTTGKTIAADAFEHFRSNVQELAYFGSFRQDSNKYQPIESLDIVLLGDILDLIRSTKWSDEDVSHPNYARPWNDLEDAEERAALARKVDQITDDILIKNVQALTILHGMANGNPITLPPASGTGLPDSNAARQPVITRIHYLLGNHDWFLIIDAPEFEAVRQKVTAVIGLANPPGPYPHDPADSEALSRLYADHQVFARHGDIYDPFNYDEHAGRAAASLGDAIVVDLLNRFPQEVGRRLGPARVDEPNLPGLFEGLAELANVRPSLLVPVWIQGVLKQNNIPPDLGNEVKRIWNELADETLESPFIREKDTWMPFDTVDLLEMTLRFSRALSFHSISELVSLIQEKIWGGDSSFAKFALKEPAFLDQSAKFFAYGHTHHYEVVPLYVPIVDEVPFKQMYFNSGTWHPLHEITRHKPQDQSFIQYKVMTVLTFYKDDERKGRRYETWTGTLDD